MSDYCVCYLRILTSGYLQLNSDFFQAFIEGGLTVQQYCNRVCGYQVSRVSEKGVHESSVIMVISRAAVEIQPESEISAISLSQE